jgi:hypothetical protein
MLSWLTKLMGQGRRRREAHRAAWQSAITPAFDQLSQFQYDAWSALRAEYPDIALSTSGQKELFLTGSIPGTETVVFVYLDQAEIKANGFQFSAEHYDHASPADLIRDFVGAAKRAGAV